MRWWVDWLSGGSAAGVTLFLVGTTFHVLVQLMVPEIHSQYECNPALYRSWPGWTETYMAIHPLVYGFVFAAVFLGLRQWSAFPPGVRGGLIYGAGVFVVGSLPVYLLAFASFQTSPEVTVSWITQSLVQYTLAGMALGCVHDGATVRMSTILAGSASRIWELLLRKDTFLFVTHGLMSYSDTDQWPTRLLTAGATLTTRVRLFGLGPSSLHKVQVVRVDGAQGEIETRENGRLVRMWNHRMRVEPISEQECRYTDCIELRAGLLTPLVWLFAAAFYRYRQRRWQQWLRITRTGAEPDAAPDPTRDIGPRGL